MSLYLSLMEEAGVPSALNELTLSADEGVAAKATAAMSECFPTFPHFSELPESEGSEAAEGGLLPAGGGGERHEGADEEGSHATSG